MKDDHKGIEAGPTGPVQPPTTLFYAAHIGARSRELASVQKAWIEVTRAFSGQVSVDDVLSHALESESDGINREALYRVPEAFRPGFLETPMGTLAPGYKGVAPLEALRRARRIGAVAGSDVFGPALAEVLEGAGSGGYHGKH